jgi:hypothetical protein
VKTLMAASLMASFVAGFANTGYPTYIESIANSSRVPEAVFLKSRKRSYLL